MQISEISAADLGGLRGLGLSQGDVEARAADAGVELTEAISPNALAPAAAPTPAPGSGSTNFDLSPPTLSPSVGKQTGLTGRKLTLALDTKVAAAIKRPSTAAKLVSKVKAAKGKVRVTPQAAKALVKSIEKVSPAAAQQAAKTLAPAVTTAPAAAPAASAAPQAQTMTLVENPMKKWLIWGGIGVAVLGAAFLFLRRRSSSVRVVPSVATQGIGRYASLSADRAVKLVRREIQKGLDSHTMTEVADIIEAAEDSGSSAGQKKLTRIRNIVENARGNESGAYYKLMNFLV